MNINDPLRNAAVRSNPNDMQKRPTKSLAREIKYEDQAMRDLPDFNVKKQHTEISPRDGAYSGNVKNYLPSSLQTKNDNPQTKIFKSVLVTLGSPIILPCLASHAVAVAVGNAQNTSIAKDANQLTERKNVLLSQINYCKTAKNEHELEIHKYTDIISNRREEFPKMLEAHLKEGKVFNHNINRESVFLTNYQLKTEIYFVGIVDEEKAKLSTINADLKLLEKELDKINEKLESLNLKNVKITK